MRRAAGLTLLLASMACAHGAAAEDSGGWAFGLDLRGYLEGRLVLTDDTRGTEDEGLGKTRYGGTASGERRFLPRAEGALVLQPRLGFDISGYASITVNEQQRTAVDVQEAFFQYKPAPTGAVGIKARAGVFFPPISLENTGLAWTSPYTLTPSAINSWVGEELKTIGGEATAFYHDEDVEIAATAAIFTANDPAGTLLAWRGWTLTDRTTGLFDRLALPPLRITRPTGALYKQAHTEEPFHEIDGRVGYYASLTIDDADFGKLTAMRYDNRANDKAFALGQWAWHTAFWSVGYKIDLPWDLDFMAQGMQGKTSVVTLPDPVGPLAYGDFWSGYGLVSKNWGRHRVSFRFERFGVGDEGEALDNNTEHGTAMTFAYIFRPEENQRMTLEVIHIDSRRPERAFLGFPVMAHETQVQLSYRLFLNTGL